MKISVKAHGGWGGRLMPAITVDTANLPPGLAGEVESLVTRAQAAPAADPAAMAAARDRAPEAMTYTLTIDRGAGPVTLRSSDLAGDAGVAALVEWVRQHGVRAQ